MRIIIHIKILFMFVLFIYSPPESKACQLLKNNLPYTLSQQIDEDKQKFQKTFQEELNKTYEDMQSHHLHSFITGPEELPSWFFNPPSSSQNYVYTIGISDPGMKKPTAIKLAVLRAKGILTMFQDASFRIVRDYYMNEQINKQFEVSQALFKEYGELHSNMNIIKSRFHLLDTHFTKYQEALVIGKYKIDHNNLKDLDTYQSINIYGELYSGNFQVDNGYTHQELYKYNITQRDSINIESKYTYKRKNNTINFQSHFQDSTFTNPYTHYHYLTNDTITQETSQNIITEIKAGLWAAFINNIYQLIDNNIQGKESVIKTTSDVYNQNNEELQRTINRNNIRCNLQNIKITSKGLAVNLNFKN